jgi:hypothetical protein
MKSAYRFMKSADSNVVFYFFSNTMCPGLRILIWGPQWPEIDYKYHEHKRFNDLQYLEALSCRGLVEGFGALEHFLTIWQEDRGGIGICNVI